MFGSIPGLDMLLTLSSQNWL